MCRMLSDSIIVSILPNMPHQLFCYEWHVLSPKQDKAAKVTENTLIDAANKWCLSTARACVGKTHPNLCIWADTNKSVSALLQANQKKVGPRQYVSSCLRSGAERVKSSLFPSGLILQQPATSNDSIWARAEIAWGVKITVCRQPTPAWFRSTQTQHDGGATSDGRRNPQLRA